MRVERGGGGQRVVVGQRQLVEEVGVGPVEVEGDGLGARAGRDATREVAAPCASSETCAGPDDRREVGRQRREYLAAVEEGALDPAAHVSRLYDSAGGVPDAGPQLK